MGFEAWAVQQGLPVNMAAFEQDADADGLSNGLEYALGLAPGTASSLPRFELIAEGDQLDVSLTLPEMHTDLLYILEASNDLQIWQSVETTATGEGPITLSAMLLRSDAMHQFVRLTVGQISP